MAAPSQHLTAKQNILSVFSPVDINEESLLRLCPKLLETLLKDHTTGRNIIWGTKDYEAYGERYGEKDEIAVESITGKHGGIIMPRSWKPKEVQRARAKQKAEIFTPMWICNAQCNLVDEAWFRRKNTFNRPHGQKRISNISIIC